MYQNIIIVRNSTGEEVAREPIGTGVPIEKALVKVIQTKGWVLYGGDTIEIINDWVED